MAHTCIIASFGTVTTSERKSRDAFSLEAAHFSLRLAEKMVSVLLTATVMLGCLGWSVLGLFNILKNKGKRFKTVVSQVDYQGTYLYGERGNSFDSS